MKKILIINAYYYPGWRSGGPQQTIMNVVEVFGSQSQIHILTHNHDMGESELYPNICYDVWTDIGKAKVYYSSKEKFTMTFLRELANQFDLVYLCGPYCEYSYKVLLLNRMKHIKTKIVLASMGSFSKGALSHKQFKKRVFWTVFKTFGFYKDIMWSFTSEMEKNEAIARIGKVCSCNYYIAEDLPRHYIDLSDKRVTYKKPGNLRIVFLSRICPQKNLIQAIDVVSKLNGDIQFDIYGTQEDAAYWKQCEKALSLLGSTVKWSYCGAVPSENVIDTFLNYDVFLFPSMGENFGHVIYEALMAGCIPLVSNRTPWNNLEENECGYSIPLENVGSYVDRVQQYVNMDDTTLSKQRINAMKYAEKKYQESVQLSGYSKILN